MASCAPRTRRFVGEALRGLPWLRDTPIARAGTQAGHYEVGTVAEVVVPNKDTTGRARGAAATMP